MSITSNIYLFSRQSAANSINAFDKLLDWTGAIPRAPEHCPYPISRTIGSECGWELAQPQEEFQLRPFQEKEQFKERDPKQSRFYFREGTCLCIDLSVCRAGARVKEAIIRGIPDSIRGNFAPADIFLSVGEHDVIEVNFDEQRLAGRATASVDFFGYGVPSDGDKMRKMFWDLPEVIQIQHELSAIIGEVETAMSFYA